MEFKQPRKKRISFSENKAKPNPHAKKLKWFEDDDEWLDLVHKVRHDDVNKKPKKKLAKIFFKTESPYDDPKLVLPNKKPKVIEKVRTKASSKKLKKLTKKTKLFMGVASVVLIVGVFGLNMIFSNNNDSKDIAGASTLASKSGNDLPREKPNFKILYPGNKNEETVGEIVKISPPNQPASYVYPDEIAGNKISVTQSQLTDNLKQGQDSELQKVANDFQANRLLSVDSTKVYIGLNVTSNIQRIIFIKGNLLVLITSFGLISDEVWRAYISSLHI